MKSFNDDNYCYVCGKDNPNGLQLSFKYDEENGCAFWHWVVFIRDAGTPVVLDSAADLENNERTDFNNMAPKWFIEVYCTRA